MNWIDGHHQGLEHLNQLHVQVQDFVPILSMVYSQHRWSRKTECYQLTKSVAMCVMGLMSHPPWKMICDRIYLGMLAHIWADVNTFEAHPSMIHPYLSESTIILSHTRRELDQRDTTNSGVKDRHKAHGFCVSNERVGKWWFLEWTGETSDKDITWFASKSFRRRIRKPLFLRDSLLVSTWITEQFLKESASIPKLCGNSYKEDF